MLKHFLFVIAISFGISNLAFAQDQSQLLTSETKTSGYYNTTEFNISRGFRDMNNNWMVGLSTINGYQFNQHISAGLGIGIDKPVYNNGYDDVLSNSPIYLPVFSDVRIFFGKGNTQPYFEQAIGYSFCIYRPNYNSSEEYFKNIGGIMLNPSFGIKTKINSELALNISFGYRFQEETIKNFPNYGYDYGYYYPNNKFTFTSHLLTLKTGLTF